MNGMPKRQIIARAKDFLFREKSIGLNVRFFISIEGAWGQLNALWGVTRLTFAKNKGVTSELRQFQSNVEFLSVASCVYYSHATNGWRWWQRKIGVGSAGLFSHLDSVGWLAPRLRYAFSRPA